MITTKTVTHYTITPDEGEQYAYSIVKGENGNIYKFGVTSGSFSFSGGPGVEVYEANNFVDWFRILLDQSIGLTDLPRFVIDLEATPANVFMREEIYKLTMAQVNFITNNYSPIQVVRSLGIIAMAHVFFLANVWGNLTIEEERIAAINTLGAIGEHFIRTKVNYTKQKYIRDLRRLEKGLIELRGLKAGQAKNLVTQIYENTNARFN